MKLFSYLGFKTAPQPGRAVPQGLVHLAWDTEAGNGGALVITNPAGGTRAISGNASAGTPVGSIKSVRTLTNTTVQPSDGDTVTIGDVVYTFQTTLTNVAGHVKIGASATASMTNLFHAINATGGTAGTDYALLCVAHPDFIATNPSATTVVITALVGGIVGNITPTESSAVLSWALTTAGVDGTPASKGDVLFDGTNLYFANADLTTASLTGWRKIAHSAL